MFGIVGLLLFEQVVNDQALAGFSQPQLVSKFHLGGAFTAGDDVDVGVVEAKDFVLVLDLSFSNDSFVSLIDGRLDLAEDAFQPILEELDSTFAQLGFAAPLFEQGEVATGVTGNSLTQGFHFPQDAFALFPAVLDAVGGGHFHDEAVDVAEEFKRILGYPVFEALAADDDGGFHQRAGEVAEQNPVDGEVDVGFEAGAVEIDVFKVELFFEIEVQCLGVVCVGKHTDEALVDVLE